MPSSTVTPKASWIASALAKRASLTPAAFAISPADVAVSSRATTTTNTAVSVFATLGLNTNVLVRVYPCVGVEADASASFQVAALLAGVWETKC